MRRYGWVEGWIHGYTECATLWEEEGLGGCICVSESADMDWWMDGYTDT